MKIILGSSSKFRRKVFSKVVPIFESMAPGVDESAIRDPDPYALTMKLAHAKTNALLPKVTEPALLVTSDQVVVFHGQILEKPTSVEQARAFLSSYSGEMIKTVNAVVVTNTATGQSAEGYDSVQVIFKALPPTLIEDLLTDPDLMHCCGAIRVEHPRLRPYVTLNGTIESLQGVPVELVKRLMSEVHPI